jgi:hypothetical protein
MGEGPLTSTKGLGEGGQLREFTTLLGLRTDGYKHLFR